MEYLSIAVREGPSHYLYTFGMVHVENLGQTVQWVMQAIRVIVLNNVMPQTTYVHENVLISIHYEYYKGIFINENFYILTVIHVNGIILG